MQAREHYFLHFFAYPPAIQWILKLYYQPDKRTKYDE